MENLPIVPPVDKARTEAEEASKRLVEIAKAEHETRRDILDWLHVGFGVEKPGQQLENFATLDSDAFVKEVRKRSSKGTGRLTPAALKDLRAGYAEQATPVREVRVEAANLERRLSELVNIAYGLTPNEIELLWTSAPPRTPKF